MSASVVPAPPEAFNFARYLLEANAGRADKAAFVDDAGALTYGSLDERARRLAAGLRDAGVKREERVLILMQDGATGRRRSSAPCSRESCRSRSIRC